MLTRAQGRSQRAKLMREIAREEKKKKREHYLFNQVKRMIRDLERREREAAQAVRRPLSRRELAELVPF
jgi:hypothetical protein